MDNEIPQETFNAIVDALCENDKTGAMLLYYRASDEDLDRAWTAIQEILVELGEEAGDLPKKAADDPSYHALKHYLTADAATRQKDIIQFSLFALVLFGIAAYLLVPHSTRLVTSLRSFSWPSTEATVVKARTYSRRSSGSRYPQSSTNYMDFIFRYEVDGQEYSDSRRRVAYYDLFGDKPLKPGDSFPITYQPDNPAVTIYDKQIYRLLVTIAIGLILFVVGALGAMAAWSVEHNHRRLKRLDNNRETGQKSG